MSPPVRKAADPRCCRPPLTAAAAQIAASHGEPSPASITAVATTQAQALDVVFHGAKIPDSKPVHVSAIVMTGQFVSYRSGPPSAQQARKRCALCRTMPRCLQSEGRVQANREYGERGGMQIDSQVRPDVADLSRPDPGHRWR